MANNRVVFGSGKMFGILGLICLALFVEKSYGREFSIGGTKGWGLPIDTNQQSYNQWAENNRFQIGDSIVFVYPAEHDSVLLVSRDDYTNCNTDNPIKKFDDGHTVFTFDKSGHHYFISGNKDNCNKNEKVVVVVLADRTKPAGSASPPSPGSDPAPGSEPAPGSNPSPSPAQENEPPPPPSAASSGAYTSLLGFIGAFAASSLVLIF